VLVENVAALLVRGMETVLGDLAACGYDAEWQSLPAAAFGAPHIRERVFILAHPKVQRCGGVKFESENGKVLGVGRSCEIVAYPNGKSMVWTTKPRQKCNHWTTEPAVGRVADGIPARVDRLRALGNAVVPQVAEWIGRQILDTDAESV
jgi:DNA (cytosine-5)-methyltransferase 1